MARSEEKETLEEAARRLLAGIEQRAEKQFRDAAKSLDHAAKRGGSSGYPTHRWSRCPFPSNDNMAAKANVK